VIREPGLLKPAIFRNFIATLLVALSTTGCLDDNNQPPVMAGLPGDTTLQVGQRFGVMPMAADPDGDPVTFEIKNQPRWATFDPQTGELTGVPGIPDVGTYADVRISVSDGKSLVRGKPFDITVLGPVATEPSDPAPEDPPPSTPPGEEPTPPAAANTPPTISGKPATSVTAGQAYVFTPTASDSDGDKLTFSIANKPSWASFSASTGRLSGTPSSAAVGSYANISISVFDGAASASLPPFNIVVERANSVPTISGKPATTVPAGQAYVFTPTASDSDGDKLTFSIANKPSWASFSATTGRLSGTPASSDAGAHVGISISVSDGQATASLPAFEIMVEAVNRAPSIGGSPSTTVSEGQAYSFKPTASDPDGDPLTFSISGKPSWATFSTSTGQLSGTPGEGTAGTYSNIVISVTDGKLTTSLAAFSITVKPPSTGSATLSWSSPTARTDGSALTNLAGYRIYYGTSSGSLSKSITIDNPGVTTYVVENLSSGTYFFAMTAFDAQGVESSRTNPVSKTIP